MAARSGPRYDVVEDVRRIIRQHVEETGRSPTAIAVEWGIPTTTMSDFLAGKRVWNLERLTQAVNGLGVSPVEFFLRAPYYHAQHEFGAVARVRNLLPEEELKRWAEAIGRLKRLGVYGPILDGLSAFAEALEIERFSGK